MARDVAANADALPTARAGRPARVIAPLAGAAAGLGWFIAAIGTFPLDPTDLTWMQGDHAQHLYGWLFFRNEPWRFPLGTIRNLAYPLGTTLGFTDSNPLLSVLLKPASGWLPQDFQFIGPWLLACFMLQGVFAARIMQTLTPRLWPQICGAALFVLAPPLLTRVSHDTLSAHWLLLALIWLHLRRTGSAPGTIAWMVVCTGIAAGVHPYLTAMVVMLSLALCVRMWRDRAIDLTTAGVVSAGLLIEALAIFTLFGYFAATADLGVGGFGIYSADLLTFINPLDYSTWLPALPTGEGQYEGFSYLGVGMLALAIAAIGLCLRRRHSCAVPARALPLVIAAGLMAVFALSDHITVAGHEIMTARGFYAKFSAAVEPLRASGRFIWPLHYVVMTGILAVVAAGPHASRRLFDILLVVAMAMQFAEVRPNAGVTNAERTSLEDPAWRGLGTRYRHIALYPPFNTFEPDACDDTPFTWDDTMKFVDLAYRERMSINSAYLARTSVPALEAYCNQLRREVTGGLLHMNTVYIVGAEAMQLFTRPDVNAICGKLDDFNVCVHGDSNPAFRHALWESRHR